MHSPTLIRRCGYQLIAVLSLLKYSVAELPSDSYGSPPRPGPAAVYGPPGNSDQSGGPRSTGGSPPHSSGGGQDGDSADGSESAQPEPFSFSYEVKDAASGNDFSHRQESDGKTVTGEYKVLLPDGRNQIVTYKADEMGYNAEVKYDGEAMAGPPGGAPGGGSAAGGGYPPSSGGGAAGGGYPPSSGNAPAGGGYPPSRGNGGSPKPSNGGKGSNPPSVGGAKPNRGGSSAPPANSYLPPAPGGGY